MVTSMIILPSGDGNWYLPGKNISKEDIDTPETLVRLYDIHADPEEMYDNSTSNPFIVNCMLTRLNYFVSISNDAFFPDMDKWADPRYYGGVFRPWANDEYPIGHPPSHN